ncbi:MAG TPA: hypothetical protein PLB12_05630 [Candidatus Goldiibacteriota bacterium]|nr:hypothetical protein [Candidatus Goldiibacteriota bacterium]HPN64760.1 hypothetical protein [Candidatus Goldiibacteriota bacterium]HRQ43815.1 hypothetical protein [Candidatus Goldiibacteriota bacterium]
MKKVFVICFVTAMICIMASCSKNDSGPASPAVVATPTPWATIAIQAFFRGQDNAGTAGTNPMPLAWCDIYVKENLTPCVDATVVVNLTPVPQTTPGQYSLSTTQGYYAAGQTANLKVTINGADFTASAVYPGGQTFTAATNTVSWLYEGNYDMVYVYDSTGSTTPAFSTANPGNANSPIVLDSNLFINSGTYSIKFYAWDKKYGVISGPGISASSYIELLGNNFMSYVKN